MAFVRKKELEEENQKLKKQIERLENSYEKRDSMICKVLTAPKNGLIEEKNELLCELKNKNDLIDELNARISELEWKIGYNARGAGRKPKATDEIIAEAIRLRNEGYSLSQIADIITRNTDIQISKSTVHKILKTNSNLSEIN